MNATPSHARLNGHYILMQMGFWTMFAAICAYQAALLLARGFTNSDVGIIIAVRCLAGIVCQPLLGGFADKHPKIPLKWIVVASLGLSFCAAVVFLLHPMQMAGTLVVMFLMGGFEISAYPLMDALAIQYINQGVPIRYSLGRGLGSISYAVCCIFLGFQAGRFGVETTLITHAVLMVLEMAFIATFPTFCPDAAQLDLPDAARPKPQSALALLRSNPRFCKMLLAIFFGLTGILPLSNFLINIIQSRGGGTPDLGLALFIMAGFELPTAFLFQRLLRRFGSGHLLLMSLCFCAAKVLCVLLAPSLFWVYLSQPLQMLGYGLFTPASVFFVNESVPEGDRVKGQTLMMVASNGFGGVAGSLLPGVVLDLGGVNAMLLFCLACCLAGAALAYFTLRTPKGAKEIA